MYVDSILEKRLTIKIVAGVKLVFIPATDLLARGLSEFLKMGNLVPWYLHPQSGFLPRLRRAAH